MEVRSLRNDLAPRVALQVVGILCAALVAWGLVAIGFKIASYELTALAAVCILGAGIATCSVRRLASCRIYAISATVSSLVAWLYFTVIWDGIL